MSQNNTEQENYGDPGTGVQRGLVPLSIIWICP